MISQTAVVYHNRWLTTVTAFFVHHE